MSAPDCTSARGGRPARGGPPKACSARRGRHLPLELLLAGGHRAPAGGHRLRERRLEALHRARKVLAQAARVGPCARQRFDGVRGPADQRPQDEQLLHDPVPTGVAVGSCTAPAGGGPSLAAVRFDAIRARIVAPASFTPAASPASFLAGTDAAFEAATAPRSAAFVAPTADCMISSTRASSRFTPSMVVCA